MAITFEKIASVTTTGSTGATITFSSIPATFTDLCLRMSGKFADSVEYANANITFNGATTNFGRLTYHYDYFNQIITASSNGTSTTSINVPIAGSYTPMGGTPYGISDIYIPSYANASYNKVTGAMYSVTAAAIAYGQMGHHAGLWSSTAAISSISITNDYANWVSGSTFNLYGIKNS